MIIWSYFHLICWSAWNAVRRYRIV